MAAKLAKLTKFVGLEGEPDDKAIKQALSKKLEGEAVKAMEGEEGYGYEDSAKALEEMAKAYEDAHFEEEEGDEPSHVVMRRMATKFRRMAKMGKPEEGGEPFAGKETPAEEAAEEKVRTQEAEEETKAMQSMAARLGLPRGATVRQIQLAMDAKTVGLDKFGELERRLNEVEKQRAEEARTERRRSAELAFEQAVAQGRTKDEKRDAFVATYERNPKDAEALLFAAGTFASRELLFTRFTSGGAPVGVNGRQSAEPTGPDRRVVTNQLAQFVVEGERFSKMAQEMADAKDGEVKLEIDQMLSDHERDHGGYRLMAANRLLRQRRPDLWAAAEESASY